MEKIENAKKFLRWKPTIKFKTGVTELLNNIHFWKKAPLWNKTKIKNATKIWFKYLN